MIKEELKQEAEESFEQYKVTDEDYVVSPYSDDMGEKMLMYNDEYYAEETYLRLYKQGYLAGAEPREKRIAELEKENAELKEKLGNYQKGMFDEIEKRDINFTKAIEIIEGLMRFCRCFAQHHTEDIRYKEAEQFLSEVEK